METQQQGRTVLIGTFDPISAQDIKDIQALSAGGQDVVVGVLSDDEATAVLNRRPLIKDSDRAEILMNVRGVSEAHVISPRTGGILANPRRSRIA